MVKSFRRSPSPAAVRKAVRTVQVRLHRRTEKNDPGHGPEACPPENHTPDKESPANGGAFTVPL